MARKRIILSRTLKVFGFILLPITLGVFASTYIPPDVFWPAGIIALFIPHLLVIHMALVIYWLFRRAVWILIPLSLLAIGYGHIRGTISLHDEKEEATGKPLLTVLSYNVNWFRGKASQKGEPSAETGRAIAESLLARDADVICFQKFPDLPGSFTKTSEKLLAAGYVRNPPMAIDTSADGGVIIFTKRPVLGQGEFEISKEMAHRAAYIDVESREGTPLRVVNLHLPAINIIETGPFAKKPDQDRDEMLANLQVRQEARAEELNRIMDFLAESPHPVIICGDFNETPYSYTYRKLNAFYDNAFEEAGRGLGRTYLPFSPFLLRIDHQFYDDRIEAGSFETLQHIKLSDHYPIMASYITED